MEGGGGKTVAQLTVSMEVQAALIRFRRALLS